MSSPLCLTTGRRLLRRAGRNQQHAQGNGGRLRSAYRKTPSLMKELPSGRETERQQRLFSSRQKKKKPRGRVDRSFFEFSNL
jgi:hypothetical protein